MNAIAPSLEDQLKEKQDNLKKTQEDVSELQTEIKALQVRLAEYQQAITGYESTFKTVTDQKDKAADKIDSQIKMAASIIGDQKAKEIDDQIDNKIKDFEKSLKKQESDVKNAKKDAKSAKVELSDANDAFEVEQASFESVKTKSKKIEASIKEIQNLINQAETAHDNDDHAQMYVLAQTAKKAILGDLNIPLLDKFKSDFLASQNEAEKKKMEVETKKSIAQQKDATFSELSKKYEAARATELTALIKFVTGKP